MFFFAYDEQIGDAFEFVIADFAADFFVAVVDGYADVESFELLGHLVSVVVEFLRDGEDNGLFGSEPQGESAGGVFEQHGYESFH